MGRDQKKRPKHACNLCGRSFPSGKSLGGHMRYHVMYGDSPKAEGKGKPHPESICNGQGGRSWKKGKPVLYKGNPRKTLRAPDGSKSFVAQCKHCGVEFHSWRDLFGHRGCCFVSKGVSKTSICDYLPCAAQEKPVDGWSEEDRVEEKAAGLDKSISSSSAVCDTAVDAALCLLMLSSDTGDCGTAKSAPKSWGCNSLDSKEDSEALLFEHCCESLRNNEFVSRESIVDARLGKDLSRSQLIESGKGNPLTSGGAAQPNETFLKTDVIHTTTESCSCNSETWGNSCQVMELDFKERMENSWNPELPKISHVFDLNLPSSLE